MEPMKITKADVEHLAKLTASGYSAKNYKREPIIRFLSSEGFDKREIYAILMSKHMRWANDFSNRYTLPGFKRYYSRSPKPLNKKDVVRLTIETFEASFAPKDL